MSVYELGILGSASAGERETLTRTIERYVREFGLVVGTDLVLHDGASVLGRRTHGAFAAAYFGGPDHRDAEAARSITGSSLPIIPTVEPGGSFSVSVRLGRGDGRGSARYVRAHDFLRYAA